MSMLKAFFSLRKMPNELESLFLANLQSIIYLLQVGAVTCPREKHLKGAPFRFAPALLAIIY